MLHIMLNTIILQYVLWAVSSCYSLSPYVRYYEDHAVGICSQSTNPTIRTIGFKMCEEYCREKYPDKMAECVGTPYNYRCICSDRQARKTIYSEFFPLVPDLSNSADMCNNNTYDIVKKENGIKKCSSICTRIHEDLTGICQSDEICECYNRFKNYSIFINKNNVILSIVERSHRY